MTEATTYTSRITQRTALPKGEPIFSEQASPRNHCKGDEMTDMKCPYCGAGQEVCHDDGRGYAEDVKHEHTCSECKKTFVFCTTISFYYEPTKADCLNDADHEMEFRKSWPKEFSRMGCKHCELERIASSEEIEAPARATVAKATGGAP
jgi:hypothetical protein